MLPARAVLRGGARFACARTGAAAADRCQRARGGDSGRVRSGAAGGVGRARTLRARTGPRCAGAGHAVHQTGRDSARAALRAEYRTRREGASAAQFRKPGRVRLPALPGTAGHLLDRVGGRRERARPAWTLRQSVSESRDGPARRGTGADRTALLRRRLSDRDDAGDSDRAILPVAEGLDGAVSLHGDVSRAGDFGNSRGGAGGLLPVCAAHLLRAGKRGAVCDRAGGVAVRAGHGVAGAVRTIGGGAHAVHDRGVFLSRASHHESAGGGGAGISAGRSGAVVRRQFPTHVSGGGVPGGLRRARDRRHFGPAGGGTARPWRQRPRSAGAAPRRAVPHRDAPAGRDVARSAVGCGVAGAGGAVGLRDRAYVGGGAARAGAAHGGLLSPAGIFRDFRPTLSWCR